MNRFTLAPPLHEAIGHIATTEGVRRTNVDLKVGVLAHRFGWSNRLSARIKRLTDKGACYLVREMRRFDRDIGLHPLPTPSESLQSTAQPKFRGDLHAKLSTT